MVERTTENRSEEVQFFPKTIKTHNFTTITSLCALIASLFDLIAIPV